MHGGMMFNYKDLGKHFEIKFTGNFQSCLSRVKIEPDNIEYKPETKSWICPKTKRNLRLAEYYNQGIKFTFPEYRDHNPPEYLFDYQKIAFNLMMSNHRCLIGAEMRLGKTLPTLLYIDRMNYQALWITSVSAKNGIKRECYKWNLTHLITKIQIESYDFFTDHANVSLYDAVIFDEAHKLKNDSLRARKAINAEYKGSIIELSGTPLPIDYSDLYNLVEILHPGYLKENSKLNLRKRLSIYEEGEGLYGGKFITIIEWKKDEIESLKIKLHPFSRFFLKKDWTTIPESIRVTKTIPFTRELKEQYDDLSNYYKGMTLQHLQRQISDGFMYTFDEAEDLSEEMTYEEFKSKKKGVTLLGSPKYEQLKQDIEDENRIVIYAYYTETLRQIQEILTSSNFHILLNGESVDSLYDTDEILREMDASTATLSDVKFAALMQSDIAEGMEFSASRLLIFFSNTLNAASRVQAEARNNSMNSLHTPTIMDYIYLPVDEQILNDLNIKRIRQKEFMEEME